MSSGRITELSNELSALIDECATVEECFAVLERVDAQLFDGFRGLDRLGDAKTCDALSALTRRAADWLAADDERTVAFVMSGAGTSGRLAFLCARSLTRVFGATPWATRVVFHYLNAGGDAGLIEAQEHAEDDVPLAQSDLAAALHTIRAQSTSRFARDRGRRREPADAHSRPVARKESLIFYVGITCGLSAPYVGESRDVDDNDNDNSTARRRSRSVGRRDARRRRDRRADRLQRAGGGARRAHRGLVAHVSRRRGGARRRSGAPPRRAQSNRRARGHHRLDAHERWSASSTPPRGGGSRAPRPGGTATKLLLELLGLLLLARLTANDAATPQRVSASKRAMQTARRERARARAAAARGLSARRGVDLRAIEGARGPARRQRRFGATRRPLAPR